MNPEKSNIHDKYFQETFSDPERAKDFFRHFLPPALVSQLRLDDLRVVKESYIDSKELRAYFSDLVFEVPTTLGSIVDVVLLFEHKSAPDPFVSIQMGLYMFLHWNASIKARKPLKPIIPILYYQGRKKWEKPELRSLFPKITDELMHYLPHFEHVFFALNEVPEDRLTSVSNQMLALALLAQRHAWNPQAIAQIFIQYIDVLMRSLPNSDFSVSSLMYIFVRGNLNEQKVEKLFEHIPEDKKIYAMNFISELIEKGKKQGIEIGYQKGIEKGQWQQKVAFVIEGYKNGLSVEMLSKILGLSIESIHQILLDNGLTKAD